ncbi:alpha/beta fold hydrolase [Thalassotalea atypica]|uniref:alpha/beta fold hydrolase n=1 Tax=Thalassotalea atypica TaxID=2054316 RepID=UPI0025724496|nr:alpha/beta hydrolase [Thalassotalea atypica]
MPKRVFFIPGTMCNEQLWSPVIDELKGIYTPEHLAIPNHLTFEQIAQQLLAQLPDEKVNLVGFSLGGYIASYLACYHSERVEKVLVVANSPSNLSEHEINQRQSLMSWVKSHGYSGMTRKKASNYLDEPSTETHSSPNRESIIWQILAMDRQLGQETLLSQMLNTTHRENLLTGLADTEISVTLYASERDPLVNWPWIEELNCLAPHHKIIKTQGRGHMLPLEKPKELAKHIKTWLSCI